MDNYKYSSNNYKEPLLKFFIERPLAEWSLVNFIRFANENKYLAKSHKALEKTFHYCLKCCIMNNPSVPSEIKDRILKILKNEKPEEKQSITVNGDVYSSVIGLNNKINIKEHQQQSQQPQEQEQEQSLISKNAQKRKSDEINNEKQFHKKQHNDKLSSSHHMQQQNQPITESLEEEENDTLDSSKLEFIEPCMNDRYILNGYNISDMFFKFQLKLKDRKLKLHMETHIIHSLAISSIFLLKPDQHHDDLIDLFGDKLLQDIINDLQLKFGIKKHSLALDIIMKLVKIIEDVIINKSDRDDGILKLMTLVNTLDLTSNEKKYIKSVIEMLKKLPRIKINEEILEQELCMRFVDSMLSSLFDDPDKGIFFRWSGDVTIEAKKSPGVSKRRPDISITTAVGSKWNYNNGFGEAKSCQEVNNHFSICKDLFRIGIFSKNSIDIGNMKAVVGVQVIGRTITFYITTLLVDGMYIMLEIGRVIMPICLDDILKYLMDMNTILLVLDAFQNMCIPLPLADLHQHNQRKRKTPTTPDFCRVLSPTTSRQRHSMMKSYYN